MDKARLARWWLYPQRDCREAFQPRVYVRHWLPVKVQAKNQGGNMENNAGEITTLKKTPNPFQGSASGLFE